MMEYHATPRFEGSPPHYDKLMEETFHVLEGNPSFHIGGETIAGAAGSFVYIPAGIVHTFSNPLDAPVKFLLHMSPGRLEKYFDEVVALYKEEAKWPPLNMSKLVSLFGKYDTNLPGT